MPFTAEHCRRCRDDFPALHRVVDGRLLAHFDGPGGTQVPRQVIAAISRYYLECNANTHGAFVTAIESDRVIERAREAMAAMLGAVSPDSISFGANMTTLAFALSHAIARSLRPGDEVVVTQLDHEANRGPWLALEAAGAVVREVAMRRDGTLDPDHLAASIGPRTRLLAIGGASNALGTVNDLARARALTRAHGAWLLVDAVHYAPHFPVDVAALDPDFLLCSAYKFYGPHVGVLYTRPGLLETLATDTLVTQEHGAPWRIETGTLNHAALAGVTAAVEYLAAWGEGTALRDRIVAAMTAIAAWERDRMRRYHDGARSIPGVTVWGPDFAPAHRAPTVSITVDGVVAGDVARRLAAQGVAVWDGHFYAQRAIEVLGLGERGGLVRAGASMYTTDEEVDRLLAALAGAARTA